MNDRLELAGFATLQLVENPGKDLPLNQRPFARASLYEVEGLDCADCGADVADDPMVYETLPKGQLVLISLGQG